MVYYFYNLSCVYEDYVFLLEVTNILCLRFMMYILKLVLGILN